MSITEKILCSKSHEYLLDNENGTYTVGLTDYAIKQELNSKKTKHLQPLNQLKQRLKYICRSAVKSLR